MSLLNSDNPFVGLRPFESNESLLFFGRQDQTLELLQRLHQHHFVAVVGSSGSGKSSLIRAGLIPSLKGGYLVDDRDKWVITVMKPGAQSFIQSCRRDTESVGIRGRSTGCKRLADNNKRRWIGCNFEYYSNPMEREKYQLFFVG